jgi:FtsZ-interacting cell division protein ZipA
MDDIASPPQLKTALKEIEELKTFKTKSIAIFMAVQTMMGLAMAWSKMF